MRIWWLAGIVGLTLVAFGLRHFGAIEFGPLLAFVEAHQAYKEVAFVAVFCVANILLVPVALPLNLAAGIMWGWLGGGAVVTVSVAMCSTVVYLICSLLPSERRDAWRSAGSGWRTGDGSWSFSLLILLRINPIVPSAAINYVLSVYRVPFGRYISTALLGTVVQNFVFAFYGEKMKDIVLSDAITSALVSVGVLLAIVTGVFFFNKAAASADARRTFHAAWVDLRRYARDRAWRGKTMFDLLRLK
jgi:uncharacterized membrane protein YdjX (TVP38/TMEM64 family)